MQLLQADTEEGANIHERRFSDMDMENVMVTIKDAAVTAVCEFTNFKGYGVNFYIEAMSGNSPVYFQVVFYDDIARSYCRNIHKGDHVKVTGRLRDKIYRKTDGTDGHSLLMERPTVFAKTSGRNSEQQLLQQCEENTNKETSDDDHGPDTNAVTASDTSYYEQFNDYSDIENPWEYEPEELEKIYKHIEERKKHAQASSAGHENSEVCYPAEAGNVQKPHADTAPHNTQRKVLRYPYADLTGRTHYPLATPENEAELPF